MLAEGTAPKTLPRDVIRGLQNILGASMVLHRPEDLLLYEYDGSVEKGRPGAVVFPFHYARRGARGAVSCRARYPHHRARRGHGPFRRRAGAHRRNHDCLCAHESNSGTRPGKSPRRCATGRGQLRIDARCRTCRALFRARSIQLEIVHDWRQRCGKCRWAAHARVWSDQQSRHRAGVGFARRRDLSRRQPPR